MRIFDDVDRETAENILKNAKKQNRNVETRHASSHGNGNAQTLDATSVYGILSAYNIPIAEWRVAGDTGEAEKAAAEIGFPVVIKADSEAIDHKSDMGGVKVNLKDINAVKSALEEINRNVETRPRLVSEPNNEPSLVSDQENIEAENNIGYFIQKYHPGGRELVVGAKAESDLGHLIMFGMGGIYVEILKDVVFNLSPVTNVEAKEMLSSIKMAPLLKGVRGEKGVHEEGVIEVIQRLSQLVTDLPAIQEMDLNPIIAYEDHVVVVDARMRI